MLFSRQATQKHAWEHQLFPTTALRCRCEQDLKTGQHSQGCEARRITRVCTQSIRRSTGKCLHWHFQPLFDRVCNTYMLQAGHHSPCAQESQSIKCIYEALFTSADVIKCYTETQPKTQNSKQCRYRSTVARKNSLESQEPRKRGGQSSSGCAGWKL